MVLLDRPVKTREASEQRAARNASPCQPTARGALHRARANLPARSRKKPRRVPVVRGVTCQPAASPRGLQRGVQHADFLQPSYVHRFLARTGACCWCNARTLARAPADPGPPRILGE
jgi:hypothetical protein